MNHLSNCSALWKHDSMPELCEHAGRAVIKRVLFVNFTCSPFFGASILSLCPNRELSECHLRSVIASTGIRTLRKCTTGVAGMRQLSLNVPVDGFEKHLWDGAQTIDRSSRSKFKNIGCLARDDLTHKPPRE